MPRGSRKWIARAEEPRDYGAGTPSFPYDLYRRILKRADVFEALGPDCLAIMADLGNDVLTALVDVLWEFNQFSRLFSSHTLAWADQGQTLPGEFLWARHRAHCQICILPRDQFAPDLATARIIAEELHGVTHECLRAQSAKPPEGSLILLESIVMKFGTLAQSSQEMGYGVQVSIDGYAGKAEQARVRCSRSLSLSLLATLLKAAHG